MLYRRPRSPFRISNQLAAFAALVLLITAWVGESEDSVATGATDSPAAALSLQAAARDSEEARDVRPDRRTTARFSLMLFRFN